MTAEIVIMNKEAIALASDSAVTMAGGTDEKIFTSANKLFALSKYHPVGIMIYGNASLMEVPWEVIIKIYRKRLGRKKFDRVNEYVDDFIEFLDNGNPLFPLSVQKEYLQNTIFSYFNFLKDNIVNEIHVIIDKKGSVQRKEVELIVSRIIKNHYEQWESVENIPSISKSFNRNIVKKNNKLVDKLTKNVFEKLPLSRNGVEQLRRIAGNLFSKFPEDVRKEDASGVVIAGFGEKDTFPSFYSFDIEGIVYDKLKFRERVHEKIDFDTSAGIMPFAQGEMVATFMEGIDPFYRNVEKSYLSEIISRYSEMIIGSLKKYNKQEKSGLKTKLTRIGTKILDDYLKRMEKYSNEKHVQPVTHVVAMLPKDELSAMAESLVNLTSFKRKITLARETVGGPIDVALISKGDGFIWIKRKHYFRAELNPQFFSNYYKEV